MRAVTIVSGCLVATCVASVLAPSRAAADQVDATRYEMIERSHVIDMKVDRGVATLVVQRTVSNTGPKSDQATFHLEIPTTSHVRLWRVLADRQARLPRRAARGRDEDL